MGCETEQVSATNERYKSQWIITTSREKGRVWGEGYHVGSGTKLRVKLTGKKWIKVKWPEIDAGTEEIFWKEFACHKAMYIKAREREPKKRRAVPKGIRRSA